jgi:hypothetical protein
MRTATRGDNVQKVAHIETAAQGWRLLNGSQLLPDVLQGAPYENGLPLHEVAA